MSTYFQKTFWIIILPAVIKELMDHLNHGTFISACTTLEDIKFLTFNF
jgi:hypothetical protein